MVHMQLVLEADLKFQNRYGYEFLIEEKFKIVRFGSNFYLLAQLMAFCVAPWTFYDIHKHFYIGYYSMSTNGFK